MVKKQSTFNYYLLLLFIFSLLFQDLALQQYFGTIARSPVIFIAPLLFIFLIFYQKKILLTPVSKYYLWYVTISITTSIVILLYTIAFVTSGDMHVYGEFMPAKLIKAAFYNITFFFTAYIIFTLAEGLTLKLIFRILNFVLAFLILMAFFQKATDIKIPFISYIASSDISHIILTASEPSTAAPMFITFALTVIALRVYFKQNIFITGILILLTFAVLVFIGSKGALLIIPVSVVWAMRKKLNWKAILLAIVIVTPMVVAIIIKVIPFLLDDIESFTSFSTRSATLLAAFKSLFVYPFGQGYGTYLYYFPPMLLPANMQIVHITGLPLLSTEIYDMVQTGANIGAKSGIANEIIYNGFTTVALVYFISAYYKKLQKQVTPYTVKIIFTVLGLFLFISFLFFTAIDTSYYYLIPFVVLKKISDVNRLTPAHA